MIYFGSPAFFVEASDSLMLDRGQRIRRSRSRAPFAEASSSPASPASSWRCFRMAASPSLVYKFALINYFVIFLNLIPLLELDGY